MKALFFAALLILVPASFSFAAAPCGKGNAQTRFTVDVTTNTVCDNETKVVWDRVWSRATQQTKTWGDASAYCALNGKRLPMVREIFSLFNPDLALRSMGDQYFIWLDTLGFSTGGAGQYEDKFWSSDSATLESDPLRSDLRWATDLRGRFTSEVGTVSDLHSFTCVK